MPVAVVQVEGRRQGRATRLQGDRRLRPTPARSERVRASPTAGRCWPTRRTRPTRSWPRRGHGTLADDATYQQWNDRLGDAGVVNLYAAPEAGVYLAGQLNRWAGYLTDSSSGFTSPELMPSGSAAIDPTGTLDPGAALVQGRGRDRPLQRRRPRARRRLRVEPARLRRVVGDRPVPPSRRLPDDTAAAFGVVAPDGLADRRCSTRCPAMRRRGSVARAAHRQIEQVTGTRAARRRRDPAR